MKRSINIVGGGFSGLTLAYELIKLGFNVTIFEKSKWGGLLQTANTPEMQIESAANAFINSDRLQALASEIGCELLEPKKAARKRYIYRKGLRQWPISFGLTVFMLCKWLYKWLFNKQSLEPRALETIEQWTLRIFNRDILDYLISPALQGVYSGDVKKLSASLILGPLFKPATYKSKVKAQSVSPKLGMIDFVSKLKIFLQKNGVEFVSKEVRSLGDLSPVALAVAPWDLVEIYDKKFIAISSVPLVRITISFKSPKKMIDGFGILFPEVEKFNSLGVLANTNIFDNRGELYNESWILGGVKSTSLHLKSDEELVALILQDRGRALLAQDEVAKFNVTRWPKAIPEYNIELEKFLSNLSLQPEVHLTGNYLGKIGLTKILEQNHLLAKELRDKYA